MEPEEITPNEPERGPEESQLETEDLENIAGGQARPLYGVIIDDVK